MLLLQPHTALQPSSQPIFSGEVTTSPVADRLNRSENTKVSLVRFEAGSRTRWHLHDGDQLLLVVEGAGHIGTRAARLDVVAGDAVYIPAGEEHYHGASAGYAMAHYSILAGSGTQMFDAVAPWPHNPDECGERNA